MKSWEFEAVTFNGDIYCNDCCPVDTDSPEVSPIFADSEWDYLPVCDHCGTEHDYVGLTEDGMVNHAIGYPTYFDRFDICEAWYLYASHCHSGQGSSLYAKFSQLHRIGFNPGPMLSIGSLTENGLAIYANLVHKS